MGTRAILWVDRDSENGPVIFSEGDTGRHILEKGRYTHTCETRRVREGLVRWDLL